MTCPLGDVGAGHAIDCARRPSVRLNASPAEDAKCCFKLQDHGTSPSQLGRYTITLAGLFGRCGAGLRRGPVGSSPMRAPVRLSNSGRCCQLGRASGIVGYPQGNGGAIPKLARFRWAGRQPCPVYQ